MEEMPSLEQSFKRIKEGGFDGVELGLPDDLQTCALARRLLDECGLAVIAQQWTAGKTAAEHAASFEEQYHRAVTLKPLCVNSHTGCDFFPLKENLRVFDRAAELEAAAGVPVVHETHRGRALFSAVSTTTLLEARPGLRLAADLSHWCCVHESLLENQASAVEQALKRSYHIHARVGHSQGPQITDPGDPQWLTAMTAHLHWWKTIANHRRAEGEKFLPVCPEFGPPPYMVTLPHTRQPIADLWEVNQYMRRWLKERLT
jgi:sugar phosphate isomerase/epimerase